MVHVHGFGISGTYLEPTAERLTHRFRTFVPDLPGMGRSMRRERPLDIPGLAAALMSYCDEVGVEQATFVGNSLGCPIICEVAATYPDRIERAVLVSPAGGPMNQPLGRAIAQMALDGPREPTRHGADRRARLPAFRCAPGLAPVQVDDRVPHARTCASSRDADVARRRGPRSARPRGTGLGVLGPAARLRGEGARRTRAEFQRAGAHRRTGRGARRRLDHCTPTTVPSRSSRFSRSRRDRAGPPDG